MAIKELWVEKYRPSTVSEYVFPDTHIKSVVDNILKEGIPPHLLLTGGPGCGKSALANVLINDLGVVKADVLKINSSDENSIDTFRERIKNFASTYPHGNFKIIWLDEFDGASVNFQNALRTFMEAEADTVRFILTANHPHKIMDAIKSRCTWIKFPKPDLNDVLEKAVTVLINEGVSIGEDDVQNLDTLVRAGYPDLRKVINLLQEHVINGKLIMAKANNSVNEWEVAIIDSIKKNDFNGVYQLARDNVGTDDFFNLYTLLANNISEPQLIVFIAEGAWKSSMVVDQDLAFRSLCIKIQQWLEKK